MSEGPDNRRSFQFGLRTMFVGTFVIAILIVASLLIPFPVFVLVAGTIPSPTLTAIAIRRRQFRRPVIAVALLFVWFVFYAVSMGPVAGFGMWLGLERNPLFQACFYSFYSPLIFLHERAPLAAEWHLESYIDYWQHLGLQLR